MLHTTGPRRGLSPPPNDGVSTARLTYFRILDATFQRFVPIPHAFPFGWSSFDMLPVWSGWQVGVFAHHFRWQRVAGVFVGFSLFRGFTIQRCVERQILHR